MKGRARHGVVSGVDPSVRELFQLLNKHHPNLPDRCIHATVGLTSGTLRNWRLGVNTPRVHNIRAALNMIGFDLQVVRVVPDDRG
jgi:hypothetical protein